MRSAHKTLRTFLITGLLVGAILQSTAQTLEWSIPESIDRKAPYMKTLGCDENGYFILRTNIPPGGLSRKSMFSGARYNVSYYSHRAEKRWSQNIQAPLRNTSIIGIYFVNEKPLVISIGTDRKLQSCSIYGQWISAKGEVSKNIIEIDHITYSTREPQPEDFSAFVSPEQKILVLIHAENPAGSDKHKFYLLNDTLGLIVKTESLVPAMNLDESFLTETGIIYALSSAGASHDNSGIGSKLIKYDICNDSLMIYSIEADGRILSGVSMAYDRRHQRIVFAGFFSENTPQTQAGVAFSELKEGAEHSVQLECTPFEESFLDQFVGERKTNDRKELVSYLPNHLILRSDGGVLMIAEGTYTTEYSYYDVFMQTYVSGTDYHFTNLLVFSINPDGSIDWSRRIEKNQISREDGGYFSSFSYLIYGDKIFVIFNSLEGRSNSVLLSSVNNQGDVSHNMLCREADDVMIIPVGSKQTEPGSMLIGSIRKGKFSIGLLHF